MEEKNYSSAKRGLLKVVTYLAKLTPSNYLGPHKVSVCWSCSIFTAAVSESTLLTQVSLAETRASQAGAEYFFEGLQEVGPRHRDHDVQLVHHIVRFVNDGTWNVSQVVPQVQHQAHG